MLNEGLCCTINHWSAFVMQNFGSAREIYLQQICLIVWGDGVIGSLIPSISGQYNVDVYKNLRQCLQRNVCKEMFSRGRMSDESFSYGKGTDKVTCGSNKTESILDVLRQAPPT